MDVDLENQGASQYSSQDLYMQSGGLEEGDQGWVSWAWSFVPAIVGEEEGYEEGLYEQGEAGGIPTNPQQLTPRDPIVSIGFYCTKASVTFKVNRLMHSHSQWFHSQVKCYDAGLYVVFAKLHHI